MGRREQPQIGASDVRDDGRAIRLMVAAGAMLPEHYLAEGGNANRATAAEMGLPAIKRFQRRQEYFRALLTRVVGRVIEESVRVGMLGPRVKRDITVQFEELSPSPVEQLANASEQLVRALAVGRQEGWITPEGARTFFLQVMGQADVRATAEM